MTPHLPPDRLALLASGDDPTDLEAEHLLECASCRDRLDGDPVSMGLMKQLRATPPLPPSSLDAIAARLLPRPAPRLRRVAAPAALAFAAAMAAAWLLWPGSTPPPESHASIELGAGSSIDKLHTGNDEHLALRGEATFRVRPLPAGHRFRVQVQGDQIEVKGTTFRLQSDAQGLTLAAVTEGVVEVRTGCCGDHTLTAGQRWERPAPPAGAGSAPAASTAPGATSAAPTAPAASTAPEPAGLPAPAPSSRESASDLRQRGLTAFDEGRYAVAAAALDHAAAIEPQASWARDARTLAGAARVLAAAPDVIPGLGVGLASFDKAAQRAASSGDTARSAAARLGAARLSKGEARQRRYCVLRGNAALSASARAEVARECP